MARLGFVLQNFAGEDICCVLADYGFTMYPGCRPPGFWASTKQRNACCLIDRREELSMNYRSMTVVLGTLLFAVLCASAAVKEAIRIKVLDSETHSVVIDGSGVQRNCEQVKFDAYCT